MTTRYDIENTDYNYYEMVINEDGDYVTFEDFDKLSDEYVLLQEKYDTLKQLVTDVYWEIRHG